MDDLDPFSETYDERFAGYCKAAAEYVIPKMHGPIFLHLSMRLHFFHFAEENGVG